MKWKLVALDEQSCAALAKLLLLHSIETQELGPTNAVITEQVWALHLSDVLIWEEPTWETERGMNSVRRLASRRISSATLADATASRSLTWPTDAAWIREQFNAGNLANQSPAGSPGDESSKPCAREAEA